MYTTANGVSTGQAQEYYPGAQGQPEVKVDAVLRDAERILRRLAPPPDTDDAGELERYRQAAADCELRLFEYLFETRGYISGQRSIVGSSINFAQSPAVAEIVRQSMGEYAGDSVAYISRWPVP